MAAAGRVERRFIGAQDAGAIVGMYRTLITAEVDLRLGRHAVERLEAVRPEHAAADDVVVPQPEIGGIDRQLQFFLARLQGLFGIAPRGDVHHDGHDTFGRAVGALDDFSAGEDPADAAAGQHHPEFARHRRADRRRIADVAAHGDGIVGMDAKQERARILAHLAGREAEHRIDAGRAQAEIGPEVALPDAHAGHLERLPERAVADLRYEIRLLQCGLAGGERHRLATTASLSHSARRSRAAKGTAAVSRGARRRLIYMSVWAKGYRITSSRRYRTQLRGSRSGTIGVSPMNQRCSVSFSRAMGAILAGAALAAAAPFAAAAQTYPAKSITMIVPFAAGGPTDTIARLAGQSMGKALGQTIIVENVGGAGGTLGAARAAKAPPDGYTIFLHHVGHATAVTLYRKLPYDAVNDFTPIGLVTDAPMTLVAKPGFPPGTLKELIAYVKANKDKVSVANAGIGAASHLCGMLFMGAIETELTTVAYRGTGPAMNDLLGGQVDLMCDQATNTASQIKAGKIKAYAVTTVTRVPSLADVPTTAEAGLPSFQIGVWHALFAPKGTPKPVVDRLVAALHAALDDPSLKERFAELGTEPIAKDKATPDALAAHLKAEIAKWGPIIKKAGVYAD